MLKIDPSAVEAVQFTSGIRVSGSTSILNPQTMEVFSAGEEAQIVAALSRRKREIREKRRFEAGHQRACSEAIRPRSSVAVRAVAVSCTERETVRPRRDTKRRDLLRSG